MHASRRAFMATAAATGILAGAPGLAQAQAAGDARLAALLNAFADEMIEASPETATSLGLDKDARANLKSKLSDVSRGSLATEQRSCFAMLRRMWAIDPAKLEFARANTLRSGSIRAAPRRPGRRFSLWRQHFQIGHGRERNALCRQPANRRACGHSGIPDSQHKIETRADCEAYLARLDAFARHSIRKPNAFATIWATASSPPTSSSTPRWPRLAAFRATPGRLRPAWCARSPRARPTSTSTAIGPRGAERIVTGRIYPAARHARSPRCSDCRRQRTATTPASGSCRKARPITPGCCG